MAGMKVEPINVCRDGSIDISHLASKVRIVLGLFISLFNYAITTYYIASSYRMITNNELGEAEKCLF
jgi:hypothetical protein